VQQQARGIVGRPQHRDPEAVGLLPLDDGDERANLADGDVLLAGLRAVLDLDDDGVRGGDGNLLCRAALSR